MSEIIDGGWYTANLICPVRADRKPVEKRMARLSAKANDPRQTPAYRRAMADHIAWMKSKERIAEFNRVLLKQVSGGK